MLKSKQLLGGLLIVGASIVLTQCTKKTEAPANNDTTGGGGTTGTTTSYTYTKDIEPIITANCNCHLAGGIALRDADLTTYAKVKAEGNNLIKALSPGGKMAKAAYNYKVDNSNKIINWVQGGSPQ